MIHFVIGTKAQFIKMAPLMHLMDMESRPYRIVNLGQHAALTQKILTDFGIKGAISPLIPRNTNVGTYWEAITWLIQSLLELLRPRKQILRRCFGGIRGAALIHGDTASTLVGLHLARRAGLKVGLVEAGLSSGSRFNPFPEELIRRHSEKKADFLFAPGRNTARNLRARSLQGVIVDTTYNTGRDALALTIQRHQLSAPPPDANTYSVMTLHRLETLASTQKLTRVIKYAEEISALIGSVRFFLHEPTRNALARHALLNELEAAPNISLLPLQPYPQFLFQILHCRYLLTDGGSVQEEASYLRKPCLILRTRTERTDGLGTSAKLATFNPEVDRDFLENQDESITSATLDFSMKASRLILSQITKHDLMRAA